MKASDQSRCHSTSQRTRKPTGQKTVRKKPTPTLLRQLLKELKAAITIACGQAGQRQNLRTPSRRPTPPDLSRPQRQFAAMSTQHDTNRCRESLPAIRHQTTEEKPPRRSAPVHECVAPRNLILGWNTCQQGTAVNLLLPGFAARGWPSKACAATNAHDAQTPARLERTT